MATFAAAYPSKPSWQLQLDVWETDLQPWANQSYVNWALYIYRGNGDTPWNNAGSGWAIAAPGYVEGSFMAYRFGSSGTGTNLSGTPVGGRVLIASGGQWVGRNPDGSGSFQASAWHAAGSTLGTASIAPAWFTLATLRQAPWVPHSVGLAYVSDAQVTASWTNQWPDNGAPSSNQIQKWVNGDGWVDVSSISASSSLVLGAAANQKIVVRVAASNETGSSDWSSPSPPVFTTPAAPTGVVAAKDSAQDITVSWTPKVAFVEHQHVIEHSTNGGSSWSALATVAAGSSSYKHVAPNPSLTHRYRVRARNTDTAARTSAWVQSAVVQLLAAPDKPTMALLAPFADKGKDLVVGWAHNPVDTTAQTAYEIQVAVNGGGWNSSGKTTSTVPAYTVGAGWHLADEQVSYRVRTWGQATSGGSDGTGASPWSDPVTVKFKTRPTASILSPVDESTWPEADLTVALGFAQAEGASFVQAAISLWSGPTIIESVTSTTLASTVLTTRLADGGTYEVTVTVQDSNGLWSDPVAASIEVAYTLPVAAVFTVTYDPASGAAQLNVTIPAPGVGEEAATSVTVRRTINGVREILHDRVPVVEGVNALLDPTPTIRGVNEYEVLTYSDDGAARSVLDELVTDERAWAFLSTGPGFGSALRFRGNLRVASAPARSTALVAAAGRRFPIALFGEARSLEVSGSATLSPGLGATPQEVEAFILDAGVVCFRDPTGRRVFGALSGSLSTPSSEVSQFQFKVSEVSV